MRIPLTWLKEYLPIRLSAEKLAEKLTLSGMEVESIETIDGEPVLEVAVTANRGDCLSIKGLAREAAAVTGVGFKSRGPAKLGGARNDLPQIKVQVKAAKQCPRYTARVMTNVKIGPSPAWLARRLNQVGVRSINNVVDATNYIMFACGQPLHAFDYRDITGGKIIVRMAKDGEKMTAIDEKEYLLTKSDLLIADAERGIALGGVMGGMNSEVKDDTTTLVLESAYFDPATIRRTSKRLGLASESSYRFERHIDPDSVLGNLDALTELILELSPGASFGPHVNVYPKPFVPRRITLSMGLIRRNLGNVWNPKEVCRILSSLGLSPSPLRLRSSALSSLPKGSGQASSSPPRGEGKGEGRGLSFKVTIPAYRSDLTRPVDLVEEIARLGGYDKIPETFPPQRNPLPPSDPRDLMEKRVKGLISSYGFYEAINYSFCSVQTMEKLEAGLAERAIPVANPLSMEMSHLRPTLLLSLIEAADHNLRRGVKDVRLFELRPVFLKEKKLGEIEPKCLAAVQAGASEPKFWGEKNAPTGFFDLKGVLEGVFGMMGISDFRFLKGDEGLFHPGKSAKILIGGKEVGVLGELHPAARGRFDLPENLSLFEIDWDELLNHAAYKKDFREIPKFPWVDRDVAVVLDESVPAAEIARVILNDVSPQVRSVRLFDLYRGKQVPDGKKSLAWALRYGRDDATMTDEDVNQLHNSVIDKLKHVFNAEIR